MNRERGVKIAYWGLTAAFVAVELALFILVILTSDFSGLPDLSAKLGSTSVRYATVLTALAYCVFSIPFRGVDGVFLTVALAFTAVSDLFILVKNTDYEVGLCTFIIVQALYFARISLTRKKFSILSCGLRVGLIVALIIFLAVMDGISFLTVLVAIYFPNLVINAVDAFFLIKKDKRYLLFAIGLVLFIGCDVCVGLYNFGSFLSVGISKQAEQAFNKAIWLFYTPSQVLIALSGNRKGIVLKPLFGKDSHANSQDKPSDSQDKHSHQ